MACSVGIGRSSAADDGHTERFKLRVVVCMLLIYICFLFEYKINVFMYGLFSNSL